MSNGNVRTGATLQAEGGQESYSPEAVRLGKVQAAVNALDVTYPEFVIPDTTAETSNDPGTAHAARVPEISLIQGTVQDPRWN